MSRNLRTIPPTFVSQAGPGRWRISVWVQPGAKKSDLAGEYQGRLKVRLSAPAVDNKANKALLAYMAGLLGVRKNRINLTSGQTNRAKTLEVVSEAELDWSALAEDAAA